MCCNFLLKIRASIAIDPFRLPGHRGGDKRGITKAGVLPEPNPRGNARRVHNARAGPTTMGGSEDRYTTQGQLFKYK